MENLQEKKIKNSLEVLQPHKNITTTESDIFPCEKKPNFYFALIIIFFLFFIDGAIQTYTSSVEIILMSKGATFQDQSKLSFISYPFTFKIIIAPIMDSVSFIVFSLVLLYSVRKQKNIYSYCWHDRKKMHKTFR